ncbi:MAG: hypothetical protein V4515_05765 [Chloroflexota bacterium]
MTDESGRVEAVRAAMAADWPVLPDWPTGIDIQAAVMPQSDRSILVAWIGSSCNQSGLVTVSAAATSLDVAPSPTTDCEAVGIYRGLVLTFTQAIPVGQIELQLDPTELKGG